MINIIDLRRFVVRPTLERTGLWSRASEHLIIGTGLVESGFRYLVQRNGPALSLFQIEPTTFAWLIMRLSNDKELMLRVLKVLDMATLPTDPHLLITNLGLACIIARLKYWYNPTPLPPADDVLKMAHYWAKIYNTKDNPRDIQRFVELYDQYGEHNID